MAKAGRRRRRPRTKAKSHGTRKKPLSKKEEARRSLIVFEHFYPNAFRKMEAGVKNWRTRAEIRAQRRSYAEFMNKQVFPFLKDEESIEKWFEEWGVRK